jgi:hypothetical protein
MLTECAGYIAVFLVFVCLLFWPGFVLQSLFVRSKDILKIVVFSTAFGIAFLAIVCPVLDLIWDISLLSVSCSVVLLSGIFLLKKPYISGMVLPKNWEILIIILIFSYGFLLRSYTLADFLPQGQDAWIHVSFMHYIHQYHELPRFLPGIEPLIPVTIHRYTPGSHCIGALLSYPLPELSFTVTKVFFITIGTGSILSFYTGFNPLLGKKVALLSSFFVATFLPHMVMTTEITAEALSIFLYPLIFYFFYKKHIAASSILLAGVVLIHHVTAFAVVIPLLVITIVYVIQFRDTKYFLSFFFTSVVALVLSLPWISHRLPYLQEISTAMVSQTVRETFFNPYISMVSPLFIVLSMVGLFILLKQKKEYYPFLISWGVSLFVATQVMVPMLFYVHRFLAFFIFPCSILASLGLLYVQNHLKNSLFVLLFLLVFSTGYPPHFWPSTGEDNLYATGWVQDSTLDPVFYVYGPNYTYVYPLSERRFYDITDFDDPFTYKSTPTYLYDDTGWVPHDISRFGRFDKLYSCSGVVIFRIA